LNTNYMTFSAGFVFFDNLSKSPSLDTLSVPDYEKRLEMTGIAVVPIQR